MVVDECWECERLQGALRLTQDVSSARAQLLEQHYICECCKRQATRATWDHLYACCAECAWCASLEHDDCHHGECREETSP